MVYFDEWKNVLFFIFLKINFIFDIWILYVWKCMHSVGKYQDIKFKGIKK